ncbi:MAG: sugar phosphate isomerase/epimerase [Bryobacteraceae bacterium]|nr:TIM barrel protein [Solibacteraceae bacterium]MCO5351615.1 sugar phosphate isomerase/epimerase [Bryobacteraceae bacterium]
MTGITRRRFAAAAALLPALKLQAARLERIGAQLYTLRSVLPQKPAETLRALEQIGYNEVEVVGGDLPKIWDALRATRLKAIAVHFDAAIFTRDTAKLDAALDDAKAKGFAYVLCPWVPPDQRSADAMQRLGAALNEAGRKARARGLTLCYHNHAFEFAPMEGGGTMLDRLLRETDPSLVQLEFDIMWSQVAGVDPVSVLKKYAGRVPLVHLKNVKAGIGPRFDEKVPREAFQEVGQGAIAIAPVLRAAVAAGAKHFFVEQDQTPGDPIESLRGSFNYLRGLEF